MKNRLINICKFLCISLLITAVSGCGKANEINKEVITIDMGDGANQTQTDIQISTENNAGINNSENTANPMDTYSDYDGNGYLEYRGISSIDPQDLKMNSVIYYPNNPEEFNMVTPCDISFDQISLEVSDTEMTYIIPVKITMEELYSEDNVKYSGCITPSIEFADNITGGLFAVRDTKGNDLYDYSITFSNNGEDYTINYKCNVTVEKGEYTESVKNNYVRPVTFNAIYEISCPLDYDGLLMKITPTKEYRNVITEIADYSTHLLDEEISDDVVFIRFNGIR